MSKSYPYQAWVLTPSFEPKQVTFVEPGERSYKGYILSEKGKLYHETEAYDTKVMAIDAGWARLEDQEAAIKKKVDNINKKKSTLTKHSK